MSTGNALVEYLRKCGGNASFKDGAENGGLGSSLALIKVRIRDAGSALRVSYEHPNRRTGAIDLIAVELADL